MILAAAAIFGTARYEDRSLARRRLVYLFFVTVLAHVAVAATLLQAAHAQIHERRDLERRVAASSLSQPVFVTTPIGVERAMVSDYMRNGIDFSAPVIYARDLGELNPRLRDYYRDRDCYSYRFDPDSGLDRSRRAPRAETRPQRSTSNGLMPCPATSACRR